MRQGRGSALAATLAVLAAVASVSALAPASAIALDSDLKRSFAFRLEASNGYEIIAFASSQRADGRGEIGLIVHREDAAAFYLARADLTATSVRADLGRLGAVSLEVVPSGTKRKLKMSCGGEEPETVSIEPQIFRGRFEFHGEEGFTEAVSGSPRDYNRFLASLVCGAAGGGESSGTMLPGARLRLRAHRGDDRLYLQANKNRPGARTRLEVETKEKREGIFISRSRELWVGGHAFHYDPLLRSATIAPPAPFSGHATFRATAANRWTGNLSVDLPGRSDVRLAGVGIEATLVHACRQEGSSRGCRPVPPA